MSGRILCIYVSEISLSDVDRLVLLLMARRLIIDQYHHIRAVYDDTTIYISVGDHYVNFEDLYSRQFDARVEKDCASSQVHFFVDEILLRSLSEQQLGFQYEEEVAMSRGFSVIVPKSVHDN